MTLVWKQILNIEKSENKKKIKILLASFIVSLYKESLDLLMKFMTQNGGLPSKVKCSLKTSHTQLSRS